MLDPHKIIKNLDEEIIDKMLEAFYKDTEVMDLGRGIQLKALSDTALATGVDYVLNKCTKPILLALEKGETITVGPKSEKSRSKPILVENLSNKCAERGFKLFLEGKSEGVVRDVAKKIKVEGDDADELIENIVNESNLQGLTKMFESFSGPVLKDWTVIMGLDINSSSKRRLSKGLIFGEDTGPSTTRTYVPEDKVPLDANASEEAIKNSYVVAELKKFCVDNNIPAIGRKDELVNRIYRFLHGETIDPEEGKPKKGEKKKEAAADPIIYTTTSSSVDESSDDYREGQKKSAKKRKAPAKKKKVQKEDDDVEMDEAEEKKKTPKPKAEQPEKKQAKPPSEKPATKPPTEAPTDSPDQNGEAENASETTEN